MEILKYQAEDVYLNYDNFSSNEILRKYLPNELAEDRDFPKNYETIGTIAHLTMREKFIPYQKIIGSVILDKNKGLKTVINKTNRIDNVFRTYAFDLLAGEENYDVTVKEGNIKLNFDIRKVFWCSKLSSERDRMLNIIKKGEVLCDAFCGVGPLAIRAAKNQVKVFANDLNPECYEYLKENIKINKIKENLITPYNMCAREFIKKCFNENENIDHVYMNLPKDALEFLDVFKGIKIKHNNKTNDNFTNQNLNEKVDDINNIKMPLIHVYCFANGENAINEISDRINKALHPYIINKDTINLHEIKDISSKKLMFSVSFELPKEVAFNL